MVVAECPWAVVDQLLVNMPSYVKYVYINYVQHIYYFRQLLVIYERWVQWLSTYHCYNLRAPVNID